MFIEQKPDGKVIIRERRGGANIVQGAFNAPSEDSAPVG
jgi:hypothetical protein